MMRIIIVRHAETVENRDRVFHGHSYGGFTAKGKEQVRMLRRRLDMYRFDKALVSDLARTRETAKYLLSGRTHIIRYLKLLREKDAGEFKGKKFGEVVWDKLAGDFETRKPPGGESINDVKKRVREFLAILTSENARDLLVVGHGAFIKLLIGQLRGQSAQDAIFSNQIDHCSITELLLSNGRFEVIKQNDTTHLKR